jgi:hypothetical protein
LIVTLPKLTLSSVMAGAPGGGGHGLAAQHGMDARHQLARVEGLGQIVVGADFQPDDAIHFVALGGQHDDGDRVGRTAQAAADGEAVFARQHQVEHDQVVQLALQRAIHALGIRHGLDREPLVGEVALEQLAQAQVVIDDKNLGFGFVHGRQS